MHLTILFMLTGGTLKGPMDEVPPVGGQLSIIVDIRPTENQYELVGDDTRYLLIYCLVLMEAYQLHKFYMSEIILFCFVLLLEVKLSYDPVCSSIGWSVEPSGHNFLNS